MNRRLLSYPFTITVASGTGSASLAAFRPMKFGGGYIRGVMVQAPGNVAFDFYIQNPNGLKCYQRKDNNESFAGDCDTPVPAILPDATGNYTAYIENAGQDGEYSCEIIFAEVA